MAQLSEDFRGHLRFLAFFIFNESLDHDLLSGADWEWLFTEPSIMEGAFAVYGNVIQLDDEGNVTNGDWASTRVAQYLKNSCDSSYNPDPPFEDWEIELHGP